MKAVLLADESEQRIRPVVCTTPKLLLPVVGRPLISYLFDMLLQNGIREIFIFSPYEDRRLTDFLQYHTPKGMCVQVVGNSETERTRAVQTLSKESEPICFLNGMHFWDFDLEAAACAHREMQADMTVFSVDSVTCREGTALLTDETDTLTGAFPFYGGAKPLTEKADSGAYLVRPSCLSAVMQAVKTAANQSPLPYLSQYTVFTAANGYFHPIDCPPSLCACTRDILHGKTRFLLPQLANGIYSASALPKGDFQIIPPVFIGANVKIGNGAKIGPNTVLEDNCFVGQNATIENSVLRAGAAVYRDACLQNAVVCENAAVKEGAAVCAGSAVGAFSTVGKHAVLGQGVCVWPHQTVENGMHISGDVRNLTPQWITVAEDGRLHTAQSPLDPLLLAAFGRALSGCTFGKKVGILHDGSLAGAAAAQIVSGTLAAQGSGVWCFGKGFLPQLHFYTAFCDLQVGIFLCEQKGRLCLYIFSAGGLLLSGANISALCTRLKIGDFPVPMLENCRAGADMHDMQTMYLRELLREAGTLLDGQAVCVQCPNPEITMLLEDALYRLNAKTGDEVTLRLSADGTRVTAFHRVCGYLPFERLLALCCTDVFRSGRDVALAADAPFVFAQIAAENGRRILHYPAVPTEETDAQTRALAKEQLFARDGVFLSMRLLGILQKSGKSLDALHRELPPFFVRKKSVSSSLLPAELLSALHLPNAELRKEGIVWQTENGRVLLTPQSAGRRLHILAESARFETAKSLCEEVEERLTKH